MSRFIPPYPKPMRGFGRWLNLLTRPAKFVFSRRCSLRQLNERSYAMQLGEVGLPHKRIYIANQPDLVQRILVEEADDFPKDPMIAGMLGLLMGNSVFVANGEEWKCQRRMMDGAFELTRLRSVFGMMSEAVNALVARMAARRDGEEVQVDVDMTLVTADIIFRTIFSEPFDPRNAEPVYDAFLRFQETAYAHGMLRTFGIPSLFTGLRYRRARQAASEIRAVLDPVIKQRYDAFHAGEKGPDDILKSLIAARDPVSGRSFTYQELCEQVATIFLAGHETSASSLSWALYLLAMDQETQENARRECIAVLGDRAPGFSDMKKLAGVRNVFNEALRLYPPVAFLPRRAVRTCQMRDKTIAAGSTVNVSPWLMHRHQKLWAEPDSFDPDRFHRDDSAQSIRQAFIPFSRGPRVCLGAAFAMQEATLILASLLRRFRFEPATGFRPRPVGRLTVRSENGIRLRVTRI
jgi:cytochrome P450